MVEQQQKLVLSPYMEIYELVVPKDNLLLKSIYDLSDIDVVERSKYDMSFKYFLDMVLSRKLDAPVPCRLDAPDFGFVCHVLADCLHQHWQSI